ncbi:uncharacterized protein BDZ83DRAFT_721901 [Colletotrichum acutatum]|uniref:NACHT domain-containing protein n=1 Tax=Glomerella acutata TaxID=27357 RepID=A0AAD8XC47_GLOAC|nr:uncharacterized protein BDZ83DRAFT_721901 [Colletotrichum acutatum]KAK1720326.1 hypothetical protein BDZ83DRAFT_721901 [Colletotrichum acutatum]
MAELAYISLAINLLQFAELGAKLVRGALERYKSADGLTIHDEMFIADARRLRHLAGVILNNESDTTKTTESPILRSIAQRCTEDAAVLIEILDALKSFEQAIRCMLKEHKIRELELRLGSLRRELQLFLTHAAGAEIDDLNEEQQHAKQEAIKEKHRATFDWVFSHDDTLFPQYFCRRGKPGSGKSILMKFLVTHPATRVKLGAWGNGYTMVIASHYFWNAGSSMQKSQRGLLQTLLYEVLRKVPSLIDRVCSRRRSALQHKLMESWGMEELLDAFALLATQTDLSVKFCFFIDGLDEYTDRAKRYDNTFEDVGITTTGTKLRPTEDLLRVIQDLASSPSIKICASSRPWDAFLDAFGAQPWQLRMEDLIKDDIRTYSLKNDLAKGDTFRELKTDLEEYFQHMIESIDPIYWESMARILRIMIESAFEFLEQEAESARYALQMKVSSILPENVEIMKKRLNARGKDLLYVTFRPAKKPFLQYQVDFLHRTVRDFFIDRDVIEETKAKRKTSHFNPALSLCRIMLALVKTVSYAEIAVDYNEAYLNNRETADNRSQCLLDDLEDMFNLLDALDHTNTSNARDKSVHWTNFRDIPKGNFKEKRQKSFLASAIQARLPLYAKHKTNTNLDQAKKKMGRPLLDYALRPTTVTPLELPTQEGPVRAMVESLLQNGADPNQTIELYGGKTPWQSFLSVCYRHSLQADKPNLDADEITDTIVAMLLSGADPKVRVDLQGGGKADILGVAQRLELSRAKIERIKSVMHIGGNSKQLGFIGTLSSWWWKKSE